MFGCTAQALHGHAGASSLRAKPQTSSVSLCFVAVLCGSDRVHASHNRPGGGAWLQHFGRCNDNTKIFASSILTLKPLFLKKCISLPPPPTVFLAALRMQCKNIAVCHCSGKCCGVRHYKGWARQGRFAIEHCRDTVGLGTAGMLCGWALQGYSEVGHCRDTLRFCRDTCFLGTAGINFRRALQGYVAI